MFPDPLHKARLTVSLLAVAAAAAGCSSSSSMSRDVSPMQASASDTAMAEPAVPEDMTATEAAIARAADMGADSAVSEGPSSPLINPGAPKRYVVKRGDTLWDISSMFLRDPWLWPEIWYVNAQIQNPHLIYPGDELTLAYGADGRPQIRLERGGPARLEQFQIPS